MERPKEVWRKRSPIEPGRNAQTLYRRLTEEFYGVPADERIVVIGATALLKELLKDTEEVPKENLSVLLQGANGARRLRLFRG